MKKNVLSIVVVLGFVYFTDVFCAMGEQGPRVRVKTCRILPEGPERDYCARALYEMMCKIHHGKYLKVDCEFHEPVVEILRKCRKHGSAKKLYKLAQLEAAYEQDAITMKALQDAADREADDEDEESDEELDEIFGQELHGQNSTSV